LRYRGRRYVVLTPFTDDLLDLLGIQRDLQIARALDLTHTSKEHDELSTKNRHYDEDDDGPRECVKQGDDFRDRHRMSLNKDHCRDPSVGRNCPGLPWGRQRFSSGRHGATCGRILLVSHSRHSDTPPQTDEHGSASLVQYLLPALRAGETH
jgi:hypothetical protein